MRHLIIATLLFTTACAGERINVGTPPPPKQWLVCKPAPDRPALEALQVYVLPNGSIVYDKGQTDTRDGYIAEYVLDLRAAHFDCEMQLGKVRDYFDE